MSLLYFQVPDAQTGGLGNNSLTLVGDTAQYPRLCGLLGLPNGSALDACYTALSAFQRSRGLIADGMVGPYNFTLLEAAASGGALPKTSWLAQLAPEALSKVFPATLRKNLQIYAPYVFAALDEAGYTPTSANGKTMAKVALGTIRAETEGFEPISEFRSMFNTASGATPFGLYDPPTSVAKRLGNNKVGDGARFKGRGFIQLTGRDNYTRVGKQLLLPLDQLPHLANLPEAAAALLVRFLSNQQAVVLAAMAKNDLRQARRLVNGGSHGLDRFSSACALFDQHIAPLAVGKAGKAGSARGFQFATFANSDARFVLPVKADPVDLRDLPYHPPLGSLPTEFPSADVVRKYWGNYGAFVLDQGQEGACTGFGLACLVNYLRFARELASGSHSGKGGKGGKTVAPPSVSPRMLYELARRYDEFEGVDYQGSSCRGALKGWHKHGVCSEQDWPYGTLVPASPDWAGNALQVSLGVYYRIDRAQIVDMQAAIAQVGAIYVSGDVHAGWDPANVSVKPSKGAAPAPTHATLPVISFAPGAKSTGGHAFALVGYNQTGFIVQNSWGPTWGMGGFAVLTYADWQANGMDAWAATLGVPGVVNNAASTAAAAGASGVLLAGAIAAPVLSTAPPTDLAARHSVVLDRGMPCKSNTRDVVQEQSLGTVGTEWPFAQLSAWKRQFPNEPARLVLYAHGGLNSEAEGLTRAREMAPAFLNNRIYPIFLVWKTGPLETIKNIIRGKTEDKTKLAGGIIDDNVTDPFLENTLGPSVGRAAWNDMKLSAAVANEPNGGLTQLANALQALLMQMPDLQIHLVGHSAGSLLLGPMIANLQRRRLPIHSAHLFAPACTVAFANEHWLPHIGTLDPAKSTFPLRVSSLSDGLEQDDDVITIYRKSLLYFVARGIEEARPVPIFGMLGAWDRSQVFGAPNGWKGDAETLQTLNQFDRMRKAIGSALKQNVVTYNRVFVKTGANGKPDLAGSTIAAAHGAFDQDAPLVLETIKQMRGGTAVNAALDLSRVP